MNCVVDFHMLAVIPISSKRFVYTYYYTQKKTEIHLTKDTIMHFNLLRTANRFIVQRRKEQGRIISNRIVNNEANVN